MFVLHAQAIISNRINLSTSMAWRGKEYFLFYMILQGSQRFSLKLMQARIEYTTVKQYFNDI